jgi:hypothetical protein
MATKPDGDTSLTLIERVQRFPPDRDAWEEFAQTHHHAALGALAALVASAATAGAAWTSRAYRVPRWSPSRSSDDPRGRSRKAVSIHR